MDIKQKHMTLCRYGNVFQITRLLWGKSVVYKMADIFFSASACLRGTYQIKRETNNHMMMWYNMWPGTTYSHNWFGCFYHISPNLNEILWSTPWAIYLQAKQKKLDYPLRYVLNRILWSKPCRSFLKAMQRKLTADQNRYRIRDHFVYAPSQWEMMLLSNIISHWLGAYTKYPCCMLPHSIQRELSFLSNKFGRKLWFWPR